MASALIFAVRMAIWTSDEPVSGPARDGEVVVVDDGVAKSCGGSVVVVVVAAVALGTTKEVSPSARVSVFDTSRARASFIFLFFFFSLVSLWKTDMRDGGLGGRDLSVL